MTTEQLIELRKFFNSLDDDRSGAIGVEEIKLPLIGLGLVNSIEEVEKLVRLVDDDGSGQIEFEEFVNIILNKWSGGGSSEQADTITTFFKNLTSGVYGKRSPLSFSNWVLQKRRSHLINAILLQDKNDERRVKGRNILNAIKTEELRKE